MFEWIRAVNTKLVERLKSKFSERFLDKIQKFVLENGVKLHRMQFTT